MRNLKQKEVHDNFVIKLQNIKTEGTVRTVIETQEDRRLCEEVTDHKANASTLSVQDVHDLQVHNNS